MRGIPHVGGWSPRGESARANPDLGMRRVRWVRVVLQADGRAVCHAIGTGHRLPIGLRIPLATALALADEGVPFVVRSVADQARVPVPASSR